MDFFYYFKPKNTLKYNGQIFIKFPPILVLDTTDARCREIIYGLEHINPLNQISIGPATLSASDIKITNFYEL